MAPALEIHRRTLLALALHDFHQLDGFLLHFNQKTVDQGTEMAVKNHGRNGDDQSETGVVQRHRNTVGQRLGLLPDDVGEPKISIMPTTVPNSPISGAIDAIVPSEVRKRSISCAAARPDSSIASFMISRELPALRIPAASTRPSGEPASRRELFVCDPMLAIVGNRALQQAWRQDLHAAQGGRTFDDQGNCDNRCQEQGPDGPTGSLNDRKHRELRDSGKGAL
jgi:hypothetical protein